MPWHPLHAVPRRHDPRVLNCVPNPRNEVARLRASSLTLCRVKRLIRPVGALLQRDRNPSTRFSTLHARRNS